MSPANNQTGNNVVTLNFISFIKIVCQKTTIKQYVDYYLNFVINIA